MATSKISNPNDLIIVSSYTFTPTVEDYGNSNYIASVEYTLSKTGYTPIGIVGYKIYKGDQTITGNDINWYMMYVDRSSKKLICKGKSTAANVGKSCTLVVDILWKRSAL